MYIISEIGNNHNGQFKVAKNLIIESKKAGADCVKFQLFSAKGTVLHKKKKIKINNVNHNEYKLLEKLELKFSQIKKLRSISKKLKIDFAVSASEKKHIDFLNDLKVDFIKIASADAINHELIEYAIKFKNTPLIISTGMCDFKEIHEIIKILKKNNFKKYSLLHCVSTYPTELRNLNLKKIIYLKNKYKCDIGFSDHSNSEVAYLLAFLYGAKIYERHFKSDNKKFNRAVVDASFSSDAATFSKIVSNINELKILNKLKLTEISKCETRSRIQFRQSFHTKKLIYKGEKIKLDNLVLSRPGNGILPNQKRLIINKYTNKNLYKSKKISLKDLK